ncbi:MAG: VWA domain-containing protein, partial [Gammaproteobacteria bacterium]|nr:VWA domain-containing protein [Gammaproteobacteria bacterium]
MFYRNLLITFIMYALVMPVWAELGQEEISEQDIAEAVIDPVLDEISPQMEEMTFDTMDSVMTDQATESSAELADTDISETAISEIEVDTPEVSGVKGSPLIKDVVLVLDNSGSMKKNDPQFLTKHAVTEFINNLDESTRAAIIIFDQDVHSAVPLTDISSTSRQGLLDSLSQINYKGLYTNSPAAIESAIYDLKNNGREEARKVIVFMTDGIVDTGNADRDLEKTKWLKEDLAADAADAGIRIFGIAFTENADFELIQSLAQKTEGEYYRALLADDLQNVFSKLNTLINKPDEPEIIEEPQPRIIEKIVERVVEAKPEPIIIEVPAAQPQPADESERKRSMLILVALAVLILAVIAMVLMLLRGSKSKSLDEETAQEAYLNDIHGITKQATFALGNKPTMLGRVAGKDTEFLNYYVIPETTIGRRHSLIEYKDFSYWIVDQGSINGTFVNDKPVTTEVRLKHGDIIRLHKIEFEFVIPEMVDSGMTVIASTAIPGKGITAKDEETLTPGSKPSAVNYDELDDDDDLPEPDFDITGEHGSVDSDIDEDTVMKGDVPTAEGPDGSDETIMLYDDDDDDD